MRYGESWPAPQSGGGPATTIPAARPARDRHARVLAYEMWRIDNTPWTAPRATETAQAAGGNRD